MPASVLKRSWQNGRDMGLIRTYAGAERLLSFEIVLEAFDSVRTEPEPVSTASDRATPPTPLRAVATTAGVEHSSPARVLAQASDLSDVCFLVTPIGSEGSDQRKHADLVLGSLLEPVLDFLSEASAAA
jgi:hypothetical protein